MLIDFALFLLIFLAFHNSGQLLTKIISGLRFSGPTESILFSTAIGSLIFSGIMTVLVFSGWVYPEACWALLGIFLVLGWKKNIAYLKEPFFAGLTSTTDEDGELKNMAQFFLGLLALLSIGLALTPAFSNDALVYHLAAPKAFLQTGKSINLPNNIYSFFPQQIEMLYLFSLALSSDSLAQLTGLGIVFLLLLGLWLYTRQNNAADFAWLTPLVFISTPTFFNTASSAYVDLQATAYVFLAFYSWENGCNRKQPAWFLIMTLFVGTAIATKLTTVIILPLAFLGVVLYGRAHKNSKQTAGQCLMLLVGSLFILSPWLARNYFFTGNPVAPFFMNVFGGDSGINWDFIRSQMQFQYYSTFGMGHSFLDFLALPINLTFFSEPNSLKFDGQIGFLYFMMAPAILGLNRKSLPAITVFFVLLVFWFIHIQYIRLLAPTFAFLSVLLVIGLARLFQKNQIGKTGKLLLTGIIAIGLLYSISTIMKQWSHVDPLSYLLKKESRQQFLARQIRAYPSYLKANKVLKEKDKVMLVYMGNLGYLMDRPFFSDTFFEAHTLVQFIDQGVYAADILNRLKVQEITHVLFNYNNIFGKDSVLTKGERAIFKNLLIQNGEKLYSKNGFLLYRFMLDSENKKLSIPLDHGF